MESLPATPVASQFGKYSLVARLATGGMAEIFLARLQGAAGFEKLVCIKRILPHLARDRQFVAMFLDEARIAARITHPNVCQVFELGEIAGSYYLAMEYLEGIPLACFRRDDYDGAAPDPRLVAGIAIQACEGLHHAHQLRHTGGSGMEVVHRDVSPQNLFVTADGIVKVLDFGIAKIQGATVRTSTGAIKGTYAYMAPEQLRGERVDRRTDVFALGIVMWETLARRHLFKRDTEFLTFQAITAEPIEDICATRPDVPPALSSVIRTALARDRDERFPTARILGEAIAAAVQPLTAAAISEEIQRAFPGELAEQAELVRVAREGGVFDLDVERGPAVGHGADLATTPISNQHPGAPASSTSQTISAPRRATGGMPAAHDTATVVGPHRVTGGMPAAADAVAAVSEPRRVTGGMPAAVGEAVPVAGEPRRVTGGPWLAPGSPEASALPRQPSGVPVLRPSWRPLAIAALALAVGGAGALIYARLDREPHRAEDSARAEQASAAHPSAAVVEPPPGSPGALPAPSGATRSPQADDPRAPVPGAPAPSSPAATAGGPTAGASRPAPSLPANEAPPNAAHPPAPAGADKRAAGTPRPSPAATGKPSGPPGFITIDSSPVYAVIYVDRRRYGETPLVRLELSPGPHLVHAVAPSGATRDVQIVIESGKVARAAQIAW
ncbi:MAG TPA: protein kinase [Kofleriaceae bacterium]|jgi:serine/threonine-protein kinase|nr:protein kinase [Kofleriaceae bacterium]